MTEPTAKKPPEPGLERRTPPHSVEAEMAVLGGILLRNEALDEVRDLLNAEDFYQPHHQRLFKAYCGLYDHNDPIDVVTLRNELQARGAFDEIGGAAYLERLLEEVHTTANIEHYARIVAEKSLLRRMLNASYEIQGMVFEGRADDGSMLQTEQIVDRSQHLVFEVSRQTIQTPYEALEEIILGSMEYIDQRMTSQAALAGHSTGFRDIDEKTNGFKPGELIILAARPAMGKTSLALNIGLNVTLIDRLPVLMFSLEMNAVQIGLRLLCSHCKVPLSHVFKGQVSDPEYQRLSEGAARLSDALFFLDDSGNVNVNTIRSKARRLKAERGALGLIIIDYIQLMASPQRFESREREIADLSRHLKMLSKELAVPVLALSQLNRQLESREDKRPRPSDLRESGSLEQDADIILFLYRDSVYHEDVEEPAKTELIIGKQRSGPTGTVLLTFLDQHTTFEDYTADFRSAPTRSVSFPDD